MILNQQVFDLFSIFVRKEKLEKENDAHVLCLRLFSVFCVSALLIV